MSYFKTESILQKTEPLILQSSRGRWDEEQYKANGNVYAPKEV